MHNLPFPFSSLSHLHPLVSFVGKSIPSIPSPICPCISNLAHFHGSFNFVIHLLPPSSLRFLAARELEEYPTGNPCLVDDNLEIFLAHSTLGRSNFHATPIFRSPIPPTSEHSLDFPPNSPPCWTQYSPSESIFLCQNVPLSFFLSHVPPIPFKAHHITLSFPSFLPHLHPPLASD